MTQESSHKEARIYTKQLQGQRYSRDRKKDTLEIKITTKKMEYYQQLFVSLKPTKHNIISTIKKDQCEEVEEF